MAGRLMILLALCSCLALAGGYLAAAVLAMRVP
jgi:hypothetical protein